MHRLSLVLFFIFAPLAKASGENQRPVFIKTVCDGKISSAVLSSLRNEISTSQKYRTARNLADGGPTDVVLTINMKCTERNDIAGIALVFGQARCFSTTNCHLAIDGSSIMSNLCDSKSAAECGRALFKSFDDYASDPLGPSRLKLH